MTIKISAVCSPRFVQHVHLGSHLHFNRSAQDDHTFIAIVPHRLLSTCCARRQLERQDFERPTQVRGQQLILQGAVRKRDRAPLRLANHGLRAVRVDQELEKRYLEDRRDPPQGTNRRIGDTALDLAEGTGG